MDDIDPNVGIQDLGIGSAQHDADGVQMPLQLFQYHQPPAKTVPKHDLEE